MRQCGKPFSSAHQHKVRQREKMKILLIEDSKLLRVANERVLVKAGYSVIQAGDGEEGLRVARKDIPDLILLDMMLPKVSGLDVLRTLKGDVLVKHIPVIVLSGLGQGNETKLLKEGAAAFFMKSAKSFENSSSALIQAVENVLAQKTNTVATVF
jgi:DNA-binding response OmpR family regulator